MTSREEALSVTNEPGEHSNDADLELRFRPSARLQRYLGRELISDPNLAVIEFVKNAYDAGASRVGLRFSVAEEGPSRLVIADDGVGMDLDSFQENWMHPGYSAKSEEAPEHVRRRPPRTKAGERMSSRTPVGEKGLGRLAAGRLGSEMHVYTRPTARSRWLHVHFRWDAFDDMTKHMDEIVVPYEHVDEVPEDVSVSAGTVVVIEDLELDWGGKLRGRPAFGRSRTRLGRLREDLQLLLRPLGIVNPEFVVDLDSDAVAEDGVLGTITPTSAILDAPYRYEFAFTVDGKGRPTIRRVLHRTRPLATEFDKPEVEDFGKMLIERVAKEEGRPATLQSGPFEGVFLYRPHPRQQRAKQEDIVGHGVLLYRDGMLVEPYGLGSNDWVGIEARKAQRQGHALIQPATFWGEIHIGRHANPELRDMANRQGLLESDAVDEFFSHVRAEFRRFEDVVGTELELRWTPREEKAAAVARDQLQAVALRTKSFAHYLRQPIMGIAGELVRLERVIGESSLGDRDRTRLKDIHGRLVDYHARVERLVNKYAEIPPLEYDTVPLQDLMAAIEVELSGVARDHGVKVESHVRGGRSLVVPVGFVEDALVELATNGIEAPRPSGRKPTLLIQARVEAGHLIVDIIDNAGGLVDVQPDTPLEDVDLEPTKGRPADGIVHVSNILIFARGRARVVTTSDQGTHIEVRVPTRLRGDPAT